VETKNPVIRHYKAKDPALYERLFIVGDGHFGYQRPIENLAILKKGIFGLSSIRDGKNLAIVAFSQH